MNYIVKVIREFDDYGGEKIDASVMHVKRNKGDIFTCSKERYLFLKEHNVVVLRGIERKK